MGRWKALSWCAMNTTSLTRISCSKRYVFLAFLGISWHFSLFWARSERLCNFPSISAETDHDYVVCCNDLASDRTQNATIIITPYSPIFSAASCIPYPYLNTGGKICTFGALDVPQYLARVSWQLLYSTRWVSGKKPLSSTRPSMHPVGFLACLHYE